jgi:HD superfamily phosphodiesterase
LTVPIPARDNATFMSDQDFNFSRIVESRFPGLISKIREIIQDSEKAYEGADGPSESFLWEHTLHVTSVAYRLAQTEKTDPLIPVVAALFHDAGKFAGGRYHSDETIEEDESIRIADRLLRQFGMKPSEIRKIHSGLKALYNERVKKNTVASILHDADFLSKFGALGVAAFFIKSALRGRTLQSTILGYLSKELTYAACLPLNMQTAAGRKMAKKKASDSMKFFHSLLHEMREARIADLKIQRIRIPYPRRKDRFLTVQLVASPTCPECSGGWNMNWTTERGVKCRKLNIDWVCSHCGEQLEISFCLPEI